MKAIQVHQKGGPEVLQYEDVPMPAPGEGQVLIRIKAAGVNFVDIYHRTGLYDLPLPFIPGLEAAGVVEAVGPGVTVFKTGDQVAYSSISRSYAEYVVAPQDKIVPVPAQVDLISAAAVMLQGMTAHYLVHSTYPVKSGETILVHAAAGGVGLLLTQMAKRLGATVIGTVSTEEKAELARQAGADHVILYTQSDFEAETKRLTNGQGVSVVYDSVGQATFDKGLNLLRPRGYMVLFGQSSGRVAPVDLNILNTKGSLYVSRPSLGHYLLTREELLWRSGDLFKWLAAGELSLRIERELPLSEAAEAHRLLGSRKTAGKLLLIP
jgi:NADPH2:quinone reductase